MKEFKNIIPKRIYEKISTFYPEEIRMRENQILSIKINNEIKYFDEILINASDISFVLMRITENSVQSYMESIKNGFITLLNGHRVGLSGEVVISNGEIANFKKITSINIRIAKKEVDFNGLDLNCIEKSNILVISPPNLGKTTLLRKIANHLSNCDFNVSIIDERFEISSGFDLGKNVDKILGVKKIQGVLMMLKTMSPDYIICDEITGETEILRHISNAGVRIIASIHADDICDLDREILKYFNKCIIITFSENRRKYTIKDVDLC